MPNLRLTRADGEDISFVTACLTAGAISFEEFKAWLLHVIETEDEVPGYFFDLLDVKQKTDYILKAGELVGFYPAADLSEQEFQAIDGIAFDRGLIRQSDAVGRDKALAMLRLNPLIADWFRRLFPFIGWSAPAE